MEHPRYYAGVFTVTYNPTTCQEACMPANSSRQMLRPGALMIFVLMVVTEPHTTYSYITLVLGVVWSQTFPFV